MKKIGKTYSTQPNEDLPILPSMRKQQSYKKWKRNFGQLQNQLDIPFKARLYFSILEGAVKNQQQQQNAISSHLISKKFLNAFCELSNQQKQHFMYQQIDFLKSSFQKKGPDGSLHYSDNSSIKFIETQSQMRKHMAGLSYWTTVAFRFNRNIRQIKVAYKQKAYVIDLRLYLLRKSKKQKSTMVLVKCSERNNDQADQIAFSFASEIFTKVYHEIGETIMSFRNEKLLELLRQAKPIASKNETTAIGMHEKTMGFLNMNIISQFAKQKMQFIQKYENDQYQFLSLHRQKNTRIFIDSQNQNNYKLEAQFQVSVNNLKEGFDSRMKANKFQLLVNQQILEESSSSLVAVFQQYKIDGQEYEMLAIKESHPTADNTFYLKGIDNVLGVSFVDFLVVRVEQIKATLSKLCIFMTIKPQRNFSSNEAIVYLMEFSNMLDRPVSEQSMFKMLPMDINQDILAVSKHKISFHQLQSIADYFSINQNPNESDDCQSVAPTVQNSDDKQSPINSHPKDTNDTSSNTVAKEYKYLNHKFVVDPIDQQGNHTLLNKLDIFDDWKRKKNGGFVCINLQKLNSQKGVILKVANGVRKLIMSGRSPLSISLPVGIFSQQSHLSIIARSFSHTPTILEPVIKSTPLQKIKAVTANIIAISLLGLSITKPFNPIIGETMQVFLDGCPLYLQQISHHPPIAYYLMYGRGYKLYGSIAPDAKLGLNNLSAGSPNPHYVQFDTGEKLQMLHCTLFFSGGFIVGDRQFYFTGKTFAIDRKNRLFSEVSFGPKNKGLFKNSHEPEDFVDIKIYQVKQQFIDAFDFNNPYPNKKDIVRQLSNGEGIWTQRLQIDGKQVINFVKNFPCELVEQQFPLASNSWYREDLQKFIEGDVEEAQNLKEQMQEFQRRDKKLRQKKGKY